MTAIGPTSTTTALAPGATVAAKKDDPKVAAQQLEAFFLRQLLSEARPADGSGIDGGFANDTFKQMLDGAIADKMSAAGGIGLAQKFSHQLDPHAAASTPPTALPTVLPTTPPAGTMIEGPSVAGLPRLVMPVVGRPSSGYGSRVDPIQHKTILHPGFDLAATTGTPVSAAAPGIVTHAGPAGTYGNLVVIEHSPGVETRYAHLSATTVHVGDHVAAGQSIGNVGTTGYSTGPHLHFEVRKDGKAIDPAPLLPLDTAPARPRR